MFHRADSFLMTALTLPQSGNASDPSCCGIWRSHKHRLLRARLPLREPLLRQGRLQRPRLKIPYLRTSLDPTVIFAEVAGCSAGSKLSKNLSFTPADHFAQQL